MKERFEAMELDVVRFENEDIITASCTMDSISSGGTGIGIGGGGSGSGR